MLRLWNLVGLITSPQLVNAREGMSKAAGGELEGCHRLVAVGDLHGDWHNSIRILLATKLVRFSGEEGDREEKWAKNYSWAGKESECLVQTGDIVDRGEFSKQLYDLFDILREQSNGRVINLLGNHEMMNLMKDWRYINEKEHIHWGGGKKRDRVAMWNGAWGDKMLETYKTVFVFNNTMFLHAGLEPKFAYSGDVEKVDVNMKAALRKIRKGKRANDEILFDEGPLWSRHLSQSPEKRACPDLKRTLMAFNIERMVVGHTPVDHGEIRMRCGGHYAMIDTFISENGYGECWSKTKDYGCHGGMNFFELIDGEAYANVVSVEGEIKISSRKPLTVKKWYQEKKKTVSGEEEDVEEL